MKQFPYVKRQKDADNLIGMMIAGAGLDPNPNDIKIMVESVKLIAYLMRYNADNQSNIMVDADKIVSYFADKNKDALKSNHKWFSMFPLHLDLRQQVLAATQEFEEIGDGVMDVGVLALEDAIINHMIKTNDYNNLRSFIPNKPGIINYVRYSVELTDYTYPKGLKALEAVINPNMDARVVIRCISGPDAEAGGVIMYNQPYHSKLQLTERGVTVRINGEDASIIWHDDIVIIYFRNVRHTFPSDVRIVDICKALNIPALRIAL